MIILSYVYTSVIFENGCIYYTGNVCKSVSLHIIYDLLYCIFLNVLEVLSFVLNLFVCFQCLGR